MASSFLRLGVSQRRRRHQFPNQKPKLTKHSRQALNHQLVRLAIPAKALKRRQMMNYFHEKEIAKLSSHVHEVLGDRLNTFYRQRFVALDKYLEGLLKNHDGCADSISDAEIEGAFEMVTEHLFPYSADEMEKIMALLEAREEPEAGV